MTTIVELNVPDKAQHQLNRALATFVESYDGPRRLLIVYYCGHSAYDEGGLMLVPSRISDFRHRNIRCNWSKADAILRDDYVEGDVLVIMDTYFPASAARAGAPRSSTIEDGKNDRKYELLAASGEDDSTSSGTNSFTCSLIDASKALVDEYAGSPFTTFHLNQRINVDPRRRNTLSRLISLSRPQERHILLCPLKPAEQPPVM